MDHPRGHDPGSEELRLRAYPNSSLATVQIDGAFRTVVVEKQFSTFGQTHSAMLIVGAPLPPRFGAIVPMLWIPGAVKASSSRLPCWAFRGAYWRAPA